MNLITKIDEYLLSRENKKRTHHYPSDAGACTLKLWNDWHDVEATNPIELTALWKMQMGDAIHDRVAKILKGLYPDTHQEEFPFQADIGLEHVLSGRIDNVIDGVGVEVKSSFGRGIVEIQKKREPKPEHLGQVGLYLEYTDIEKFKLFYIGRDNAYRTEFDFNKGDIDVQPFIDQFAIAEGDYCPKREKKACIVNGEFKNKFQYKKKDYKGDWQCAYCKYRNGCWADILREEGKFIGEERVV